jgi:SAM-dependent methyltransferase
MKNVQPKTYPGDLLRYRDSIYAADLLICAVAFFDFFTYLSDSNRSHEDICRDLQIAWRPADVMLTLFQAMGLIRQDDERYSLSPLASDYLVSNQPWSLAPYYASQKNRPQCREFYGVLSTDKPAGWSSKEEGGSWIEAMQDPAFADAFTAAMESRGLFLAHELSKVLDLRGSQSLLDIAGGSGVYACALASANHDLGAAVYEIPPVDDAGRRSVAQKKMSDRVTVIAGDMFERIPSGFDVHLFANVLHDWGEASNRKLVKLSYQAMNPGGRIVVFDAHLNEAKDGPLEVAEYSCLLMHSTEGRCYSTREIQELLNEVGFSDPQVSNIAAWRSMITARKG